MIRRVTRGSFGQRALVPLPGSISRGSGPFRRPRIPQLPELLGVHRGGRVGQRAGALLRLRERDDVADATPRPARMRDEPVQAEGDAAVRRRAELERLEQEAELALAPPRRRCRAARRPAACTPADGCGSSRRRSPGRSAPGRRPWRAPRRDRASSSGESSSRGAVNGWCIASQRFSSSFHSTSGKSITHSEDVAVRRDQVEAAAPAPRAAARARWPRRGASATSSSRSPGVAPVRLEQRPWIARRDELGDRATAGPPGSP